MHEMVASADTDYEEVDPGYLPGIRVYLVLLFGLPLIGILSAFPLARTRWFLFHDDYPSLRAMGYGSRLHNTSCDIVVFGDSAALVDIDPEIVRRETGMATCNVSEIYPIIMTSGFMPLDQYLRQNRAPKYLVFMFSPRHFRASQSWDEDRLFIEGVEYVLLFDFNKHGIAALLGHPERSYEFALWTFRAVIKDAAHRADLYLKGGSRGAAASEPEDPQGERARRNGTFTLFHKLPERQCGEGDKDPPPPGDPGWIAALRTKYSVNGTRVIVNVAPIADCEDLRASYKRVTEGLHDNRLELLPIRMFSDQETHLGPEGAAYLSAELGRQVLALGRQNPGSNAPRRP